ncbi:MAG: MCP four helix bundle domain-containing protein [Anaerolineae bacterium]
MSTQPTRLGPLSLATVDALSSRGLLGYMQNLKIGTKLTLGYGILVILVFLSAGVSYYGSYQATQKINQTSDVRVPAALAASRAQADLLRMLSDMRGYLALGDQKYRDSYAQSTQAFEADLANLDQLQPYLDPQDQSRLAQLEEAYTKWKALPGTLFDLRDDQLDREPAYRLLSTDGTVYAGQVLININTLIETQTASADSVGVLQDLAHFQGTFAAMFSALRGYVTTRNRVFRGEYQVNQTANDSYWQRLSNDRSKFDANQQQLLDKIGTNRDSFLKLPPQLFQAVEGPHWREDLYQFSTVAVPQTDNMQALLNQMVEGEQTLLTQELGTGQQDLATANQLILASGFVALLVGVLLVFFARRFIAGPVSRLTQVAERIRSGELEAQASVESKDETGILAETFNNMTSQLRQTLLRVRKEKKRADDLLEVVIPIGVELASEKDFNLLLEKMLVEAKDFCKAEAATLYLKTPENSLKYVVFRDDSMHLALGGTTGKEITFPPLPLVDAAGAPNRRVLPARAAIDGISISIHDVKQADDLDFSTDWTHTDEMPTTLLAIPLKNSQNQVLGVMQLMDARDAETHQVVPFDQNLQQMMESFSDLAIAALEAYIREQGLRQQIQQLKIEIDEAKRQKEVSEIVDSDFFQGLQERAKILRERRRGGPSTAEG